MTGRGAASLLGHVLALSLLQVGGALAIAPDLHRLLVERLALVSDAQFAAAIAIAQASPGPNTLYVAVLGYQVAGALGAAAAQIAVLAPSSALALALGRWAHARRDHRAVLAFKAGMAPVTVALVATASWILVVDAPGWRPALVAAAAAGALLVTRVHILWLIAAGAALGAAGLV